MNYWYMDRSKEGIFYSGRDAERVYDSYKKYHLNEKSGKYGAVLVSTKRVKIGYEFNVRLFSRWPFLKLRKEGIYVDRMDKVVRDDLNGL